MVTQGGGIQVERRAGVWIATLSRPEVLNAFDLAMIERLLSLLDEAAAAPELRVLILTGAGRAFSSGRDLKELAAPETDASNERAAIYRLQTVTRRLVQIPKVVCAAVNGPAIGLGAELAVACDVRYAADTATFAFPEAQLGLFFTGGVLHLLPRLVGVGRATHWLLTGAPVGAVEALQSGLVTRVTPAERLMEEVLSFADTIAQTDPGSVERLKHALRRLDERELDAVLRLEEDAAWASVNSAEARMRIRAFLDRGKPEARAGERD